MLLSTACSWGTGSESESAIGRVSDAEGNPRIFRGHRYLELDPGSSVEIRNSMTKGSSDKVAVKLRDGTIVYVGRDSELTIQEYSGRESPARLRLTSSGGQYRVTTGKSFKRAGSSMAIGTAFATILAGKADMLVEHDVGAESMIVMKLGSGSIVVKNQFGQMELFQQGDAITTSFGLSPSSPVHMGGKDA